MRSDKVEPYQVNILLSVLEASRKDGKLVLQMAGLTVPGSAAG